MDEKKKQKKAPNLIRIYIDPRSDPIWPWKQESFSDWPWFLNSRNPWDEVRLRSCLIHYTPAPTPISFSLMAEVTINPQVYTLQQSLTKHAEQLHLAHGKYTMFVQLEFEPPRSDTSLWGRPCWIARSLVINIGKINVRASNPEAFHLLFLRPSTSRQIRLSTVKDMEVGKS